jgi:hypothetical protein
MIKSLTREIRLTVQARSGVTAAVLVWMMVVLVAALTAFIFLCVAGYDWLALRWGGVIPGLVMAGIFLVIALIGGSVCVQARRRARERAILERTARAHAPSWLLDPKILATAVEVGRTIGWQRIVPVALVGFMAAQWAREYRQRGHEAAD